MASSTTLQVRPECECSCPWQGPAALRFLLQVKDRSSREVNPTAVTQSNVVMLEHAGGVTSALKWGSTLTQRICSRGKTVSRHTPLGVFQRVKLTCSPLHSMRYDSTNTHTHTECVYVCVKQKPTVAVLMCSEIIKPHPARTPRVCADPSAVQEASGVRALANPPTQRTRMYAFMGWLLLLLRNPGIKRGRV